MGDKWVLTVKAENWSDLAKQLGFTRVNLYQTWKAKPGAPESYEDVQAWKDFIAANSEDAGDGTDVIARKRLADAVKAEKQAEKISLEVEVKKGLLIPVDRIVEAAISIVAKTKATLLGLETELPAAIAGKSEAECARIIREKIDGICSRLQEEFSRVG